ncbi:hypothetical protein ACSYDW_01275 [Paeniglutamicibacter sp. R2-26]|uniref:hypothetical protein n=1 Tax=Paeniglutamicibacter sp. R2-26 TaxID=3144417 RepID=UPI003EE4D5F9
MSEPIEAVDYPSDCGVHAEQTIWVPADARSNLCTDCRESLGKDLLAIESRWDQVMDALARGRGGGDSERMGSTEVHAPLPINAAASDAMRLARDAVWSGVDQLVMDRGNVRLPDDQSTPALAGWLARWHLEYLASHANGSWTVEWYTEIQDAAEAISRASADGAPVEVATTYTCKARVPTALSILRLGNLVPDPECGGSLVMIEQPDGSRTVKCSKNAGHMIAADAWFEMHRARRPQKRGARPPKL